MGSLPLPLLLTFLLYCYHMKAVMTLLKCATTYEYVCNYINYHFFRIFQGGFHVADFFNHTLIFFMYADKTFFMSDSKDSRLERQWFGGMFFKECSWCLFYQVYDFFECRSKVEKFGRENTSYLKIYESKP